MSMIHVDLLDVAKLEPAEARGVLEELRQQIDMATGLLVLVLDEVDIARRHAVHSSTVTLVYWLMGLLKGLRSDKRAALVLGITTSPDDLEMTVRSEMSANLYFEPLPRSGIAAALAALQVSDSDDVASILQRTCREEGVVLTPRAVTVAVSTAKSIVPAHSAEPRQLAEMIFALSTAISGDEVSKYEERVAGRIAQSDALISLLKRERALEGLS